MKICYVAHNHISQEVDVERRHPSIYVAQRPLRSEVPIGSSLLTGPPIHFQDYKGLGQKLCLVKVKKQIQCRKTAKIKHSKKLSQGNQVLQNTYGISQQSITLALHLQNLQMKHYWCLWFPRQDYLLKGVPILQKRFVHLGVPAGKNLGICEVIFLQQDLLRMSLPRKGLLFFFKENSFSLELPS